MVRYIVLVSTSMLIEEYINEYILGLYIKDMANRLAVKIIEPRTSVNDHVEIKR